MDEVFDAYLESEETCTLACGRQTITIESLRHAFVQIKLSLKHVHVTIAPVEGNWEQTSCE